MERREAVTRSRFATLLVVVALVTAVPGCGTESRDYFRDEPTDLFYLSDSGGWGVPWKYGELAGEALGRDVRVHDHTLSGLPATRALELVQTTYRDQVAAAEIVVVYGAYGGSGIAFEEDMDNCVSMSRVEREPPRVATEEDWQPYRDLLDEIYREIWSLRDGRPTILRGVDIYAPVIGDWREAGIEAECTANWEMWSRVMEASALANGAVFVSPYDVFNGPGHDDDPRDKGWISPDGEHTTDDGAWAIAEALAATGFEMSRPQG